jgi:peptide/nickel transport system permease protein
MKASGAAPKGRGSRPPNSRAAPEWATRLKSVVGRSAALPLVLRRLATAVPVMLGVSVLTFWILNLLPGNAAVTLLGTDATAAQVAQLEADLGLDRPAIERYIEWLGGLLAGDLGDSLASGQSIGSMIAERSAVTIELVMFAVVLSMACAVGMALLAARNPGNVADRVGAFVGMIGISLPNYVLAIVLVLVFAVNAQVFPSIGFVPIHESIWGNLKSLTLPTIALAFPFFSVCSRFLRGDLVEQMEGHGYIVAAKAKGLRPWSVLLRHALRNSLAGFVTVVGLNVGPLIGGTVIVEQIFALPGIGRLLLQAINIRDVAVVQGIVLMIAVVTVLATLCVDLLYVALDPRIRYGRR